MEKDSKFSFTGRMKSFRYAFLGIITAFRSQHNLWIHLAATLVVICLGFVFHLTMTEWMLITFAIGLVWVAEILNTAIETLVDMVSPEYNEKAGRVKDLAAGAVLIAAIIAIVIGGIILNSKF